MTTPQEIREKSFDKARSMFGGYDMATIDEYLEELANDFEALQKENVVLKSKMKVLVDKIEEYRANEDALNMAVLSAQKLAVQIENDARARASAMLAEADKQVKAKVGSIAEQTAAQEKRLADAKAATAKFDTGIPLDEAVMEYVTTELKGVIGAQYAAPQGRILLNPFKDVKVSSWFGQYVIDLYNDGIINGTSATTYAPNDTLTWAAALKLLLVSHGDLKAADATGADWSKNAIAKAAELGLVAADLDGAKAISRLEFCQVAAKLNKLAESKTESKFTDCTDGYVMALVDAKVISGMTETTFEPAASLTRAQIAKILYQLTLIEK